MAASSLSKPQQLPELPTITRLSPTVIRILASNPGKFTLQGTNTYLLGSGPRRILLDTGEGRPAWKQHLRQVLDEEKAQVSAVLLSHWHEDHVSGVEDVRDLVRDRKDDIALDVWKHKAGQGEKEILEGMVFEVDGAKLQARHAPGHTTDHMVFTLESTDASKGDNIMFTGDNVLGHGTTVFEDLSTYLASLHTMLSLFREEPFAAYPGHGPVLEDGRGRINQYIQHRQAREDEVISALNTSPESMSPAPAGSSAAALGEWSSMAVVKLVYSDVPDSLHEAAEKGVVQILLKLRDSGKVEQTGRGWRLLEGKERADKL